MSPEPLSFIGNVVLPQPSSEDKTADAERLKEGLAKKGLHPVSIPLDVLRRLPDEMRRNGFSLNVVLGRTEKGYRILELDTGNAAAYGIALDIGTTTIECALFELHEKKRLDILEVENPQIIFGTDVLSRAQMAMSGQGPVLTAALREGVNSLIRSVCERNTIDLQHVYALTVSGNTLMSHFFLGLDVRNIPIAPNVPAAGNAVFCSAQEAGVCIHPHAVIYVFPNSGSYVGGDIISGMVCTDIHKQHDPVLFMDVGTNVEIALGCRDWIMVGAGAAGPALEGGVAAIGKKAEKGTINRVEIDRKTGRPQLTVISGGEPEGICGSGLIDLVSELFAAGIIDSAGKFNTGVEGVVVEDGVAAYQVYSFQGKELLFTERELQNFLRSKAAMFAFLYVFLRSVGMKIGDVSKIYVSGALGCGINIENAVNIGMLPDIRRDRIIPAGNSSLKGASMLLLDSSLISDVETIRSLITYREMSEDADLLNILQGALFIPHTDPGMLKG
jgi:uncharacterized 2Fe-2S/4Fe-4S cluster protein (DUF4445 family)